MGTQMTDHDDSEDVEVAHLVRDVRDETVRSWSTAFRTGTARTPELSIVLQGLTARPGGDIDAAVASLVDMIATSVLLWLDDHGAGGGSLAHQYSALVADEGPDPLSRAVLGPSDVGLLEGLSEEPLRRAAAACLGLLPESERASEPRRAIIRLLAAGAEDRAERRRLQRTFQRVDYGPSTAGSLDEYQARDVSEAFVLALEDDPSRALLWVAFLLTASGRADHARVRRTLHDATARGRGRYRA
jgi:hypothetical protein